MTNIADEKQVKKAALKEKDLRKRELQDIRTVLSNKCGRRFIWRILEECNTFGSVYSEQPSLMAHRSGKQDLGHFLMAEISNADENLLLGLMKDNKKGDLK